MPLEVYGIPLWHGTALPFSSFARCGPDVRLGAFWAAPDVATAAVYAGHDGVLLQLQLADGVRLLDASGGMSGNPVHYLQPWEETHVRRRLRAAGHGDGGGLPGDAAAWFEEAAPGMCWEGLLQEDLPGRLLGGIMRRLGYGAVLCLEETEAIENDVHHRMVARVASAAGVTCTSQSHALWRDMMDLPQSSGPRLHADAMRALERAKTHVPAVAFLHRRAAVFCHAAPIPGRVGLKACLDLDAAPGEGTVASLRM